MGSLFVNVTEAIRPQPGHRHTRFAIEVSVSLHGNNNNNSSNNNRTAQAQTAKQWTLTRKYFEFDRLYRALISLGFPCPIIPLRNMWIINAAIKPSNEILQRRVVSLDMWLQATLSTWRDHFLADFQVQDRVSRNIVKFLSDDSKDFFTPLAVEKPVPAQQVPRSNTAKFVGAFRSFTQRLFKSSSSRANSATNQLHKQYYPNLVGDIHQEQEMSLVSLPPMSLTPPVALQSIRCYQRVVVLQDEDGDELTWVFDKDDAKVPEVNFVRNVVAYEEHGNAGFTVTLETSPGEDPLAAGFDMVSVPGTPQSRAQFHAPWREFTDKLINHADQRMKRTQLFEQNYFRMADSSSTPAVVAAHVDSGSEEGGSECGRTVLSAGDTVLSRQRILFRFAMHQQDEADERNSEGWLSEAASEAMGLTDDLHAVGQFESGGMVWIAPKAFSSAPPQLLVSPVPTPSPPSKMQDLHFSDEDEGEEGDDESEEDDDMSLEDDEDDSWADEEDEEEEDTEDAEEEDPKVQEDIAYRTKSLGKSTTEDEDEDDDDEEEMARLRRDLLIV